MANERGFSLLEVLVAFAVLALVLGAVLPQFGQGFRGVAAAERRSTALAHAESRISLLAAGIGLAPGSHEGELADGFRWRAEIVPAMPGRPKRETDLQLRAYAVTLEVAWPEAAEAETVRLHTVLLEPGRAP